MLREVILQHAGRHEHCRNTESGAGPDQRLRLAGDHRTQCRTKIDAHVEHGEARIEARATLGIELGDHSAHVRLQKTHAEHDHEETEIEPARSARRGEHRIAESDQRAADEHCLPRADQPVCDPASRQRGEVYPGGIESIDRRRGLVVDAESARGHGADQEQQQHGAHAVIGEAFPHLGEE